MKMCVRSPATAASAPRWSVPDCPYSQFLLPQLRAAWPTSPTECSQENSRQNFRPNSPHWDSSPADRLIAPEDRIRADHWTSAVGIPDERELHRRTLALPSGSRAPPIRLTPSTSPERRI